MSTKDLFERSFKILASSSLDDVGSEVESAEYISAYLDDQNRVIPHVDFRLPQNFAKYGSAAEYYDRAIRWIHEDYPYDGSLKEQLEWRNKSTLLDLYIFDARYPKSTGYATLSSKRWGLSGSNHHMSGGYGQPTDGTGTDSTEYEYIQLFGGPTSTFELPNASSSIKQAFDSKSNIWSDDVSGSGTRESNLKTDMHLGATVEFWLKKEEFLNSLTEKEVIFDLWNNQASSSAEYGRLRIELTGAAAGSPFRVSLLSGTSGFSAQSIGSNITTTTLQDWNHYAFSFANDGTAISTKLYINGGLNDTLVTGENINEIRNSIVATIGALAATPSGSGDTVLNNVEKGWAKLSGSVDDFRFWKVKRSPKDIGRNWFTSKLGGGTNSDIANTDLGVYYKFNEGVTEDVAIDANVLDYSGRITNGTWFGYPSGSTGRNTGSAIAEASASLSEHADPIIYSSHPHVANLTQELVASGSIWDYENNSSMFFTMPAWIIEEDEEKDRNVLKNLTQILGSYFDNLHLLINDIPKFSMAEYPRNYDRGLTKPYPYIGTALRSHGLDFPELFIDSDVYNHLANRNETTEYEEDLRTVKNLIYNNIYTNLASFYNSKGTEKAFRNLIHCFGIGDDVIRLNTYSDGGEYEFTTKRRVDSHKTKAINFNHVDRHAGTVYQYTANNNPNSVSYISGSSTAGLNLEDTFPITVETEIIFPKKLDIDDPKYDTQIYGGLTASLFGMHTAKTSDALPRTTDDLTWAPTDSANFQVYAARDKANSKDVKFVLTSSVPTPFPLLTSSYFLNTYDNAKWNLAVRLKPHGFPHSFASGALDGSHGYIVEFYGVNFYTDRKINEFFLTASITKTTAEDFLSSPKRLYVGAHHTNFTGPLLEPTDIKVTSARYWFDYIDNDAIEAHALDPSSFGHSRPKRNSYLLESDLPNVEVPEIDSLALYWNFDTITGSSQGSGDPTTFDGKFAVHDVSSGSIEDASRYGWIGDIVKYQHTGRGDIFPIRDTGSVENVYLYAAKQQLPEIVHGEDNIRVLSQEETEVFTRETRPYKTYYAFEKSMYQVISDEMINYFASIIEFNNLIGEPVHRYRQEYKDLKYLRQLFFERVGNTPDLDKFVEYYKWLDATIELMLAQFMPASANTSDGIDNVVESHVLERNKYWSKFPSLRTYPATTGAAEGINRHLYNWKYGHRPVDSSTTTNCFWWKERAERHNTVGSGDTNVDTDRDKVLSVSLSALRREWTTPYRYAVDKVKNIHGGINYSDNKKTDYYRGINTPHGLTTNIGIPINVLQIFASDVQSIEHCDDELVPNLKKKYSFGTRNARIYDSGSFDIIKGAIAAPFNLISSSVSGGYHDFVRTGFKSDVELVNLHNDSYGTLNEVPMQSPFTEKYVGGHQSRHVRLNKYRPDLPGVTHLGTEKNSLDDRYSRPESFRLLIGGQQANIVGPDYGAPYSDQQRKRAWWFREETAKRPVNIRNILQTTASVNTVLSSSLAHGPIGNYDKTYQIVQTSGRSTNNFYFNDGGTIKLPLRYAITDDLPQTTNVHTLIGVRANSDNRMGNTFLPDPNAGGHTLSSVGSLRRVSLRYDPKDRVDDLTVLRRSTIFELPSRTKQNAVIVERFSAPGGPEVSSLGFLDIVAAEKSIYNALPWRNLSVRSSGSGESTGSLGGNATIRVQDQINQRRGLQSLLQLHSGKFGADPQYEVVDDPVAPGGSAKSGLQYVRKPAYHKVNRNPAWKADESLSAHASRIDIVNVSGSNADGSATHTPEEDDSYYVFVPSGSGGLSTGWARAIFKESGFSGSPGSQEIYVNLLAADGTGSHARDNLIAAINGVEDTNIVKYGTDAGTSSYGIPGVTASKGTAQEFVTLTAERKGATGNGIYALQLLATAAGHPVGDSYTLSWRSEASSVHLTGGVDGYRKVNDNWWVSHMIPQNDYQYAWISASYLRAGRNGIDSETHKPRGYAPKSGQISGSTGFVDAITFISASDFGTFLSASNGNKTGNPGLPSPPNNSPGVLVDLRLWGTTADWMLAESNARRDFMPTCFAGINYHIYEPVAIDGNLDPDRTPNLLGYRAAGLDGDEGARIKLYEKQKTPEQLTAQYANRADNFRKGGVIFSSSAPIGLGQHNLVNDHASAYMFNALMLKRNGPYGWPSWKQVRLNTHPVARYLRRNNTISIIDPNSVAKNVYDWSPNKNIQQIYGATAGLDIALSSSTKNRSSGSLNFREAPIASRYKALEFAADMIAPSEISRDASSRFLPTYINVSYGNVKSHFDNSILNDKLNLRDDYNTIGDKVVQSFEDGTFNGTLRAISYNEIVYPKAENTYLHHIRSRTSFEPFWQETHSKRLQTNQQLATGYFTLTSSIWPLDGRAGFYTASANKDIYSPEIVVAGSRALASGSARADKSTLTSGELQNAHTQVHTPWRGNVVGANSNSAGHVTPIRHTITASAMYSRKHTLGCRYSTQSPSSFLPYFGVGAVTGTQETWLIDPDTLPGTIRGGNFASSSLNARRMYRWNIHVVPFSGDAPWDASKMADKNPLYDSYDAYAEHMRRIGKDYSILPEYRMSERMDYIIRDGGDAFSDVGLFNLTGALSTMTSSAQGDFYKTYSHSDFMRYFGVLEASASANLGAKARELTVKCDALLKFLPYKGFYPANRTLQLSQLFSQSYGSYVRLSGSDGTAHPKAGFRPFLAPMFAPGIVFNTIKSGMAVDYPILTSSVPSPFAHVGDNDLGLLVVGPHSVAADLALAGGGSQASRTEGEDTAWCIRNTGSFYRVPFEALVEPNEYLENLNIIDMEPHPSCSLNATASWNGQGDDRYKLAMHNFLAESADFFLSNGTYTSIVSKAEKDFSEASSRNSYRMMVRLRKSLDRAKSVLALSSSSPQAVEQKETICMYSRPSAFGPPSWGTPRLKDSDGVSPDGAPSISDVDGVFYGGGSQEGYNALYTPPYYDGESWAILEFNPEIDKVYTVDEIQSHLTATYVRYDGWALGRNKPADPTGPQDGRHINNNAMQITASVNLLGKTRGIADALKFTGVNVGDRETRWVVQMKHETPILNFIDASGSDGFTTGIRDDTKPGALTTSPSQIDAAPNWAFNTASVHRTRKGGNRAMPIGMWHQYGREPSGSEGIFLQISDIPRAMYNKTNRIYNGLPVIGGSDPVAPGPRVVTTPQSVGREPASLANLVGFTTVEQPIGQIATARTISEAIVAVPFIDTINTMKKSIISRTVANERQFFEIDDRLIQIALGTAEGAVGESITQMVDAVQKYVFPPSFDFVKYPDTVKPIAMYVFEFEHTFNKQDLIDMWQNLPPRLGRAFDPTSPELKTEEVMQSKEITHELSDIELLENVEDKLQWMVFKVKQRARTNYFGKVITNNPALNIQNDPLIANPFGNTDPTQKLPDVIKDSSIKEKEFDMSYNWPYDFCSIVELAKIEQQVDFHTDVEEDE